MWPQPAIPTLARFVQLVWPIARLAGFVLAGRARSRASILESPLSWVVLGLLGMNNISISDKHAATVSNHTLLSKEIYNFSTTFCRYFKGQPALTLPINYPLADSTCLPRIFGILKSQSSQSSSETKRFSLPSHFRGGSRRRFLGQGRPHLLHRFLRPVRPKQMLMCRFYLPVSL